MSINSATEQIISDWRDLLSELETGQVRYLVIGGYAVMKYTEPYNTKDLDLWTDPAPENAVRLYNALARFCAPLNGIAAEYSTVPEFLSDRRVTLAGGYRHRNGGDREDLPFATAWTRRAEMIPAGLTVPVIGLDDLIITKRAAGRPDDSIAIRKLEERRRRK
jgi:hypothetical protein